MSDQPTRRDFLRTSATAAIAASVPGTVAATVPGAVAAAPPPRPRQEREPFLAGPPMEEVRIGFVGTGGQGTSHVRNLVDIPGCRITAVCDIVESHATRAAKFITDKGFAPPTLYTRGETDFERLCAEEELDLVFTATPWEWHVPVALAAMANGKHAASEVPFATSVEDCWAIVEAAERERKHCIMMENCNYDRPEMLALNLVRQGLLGEVLNAECGYIHDLRGIKFADQGEGLWRRAWATKRNGNLYPTHGLGPVSNCLDINRGDRYAFLVSMSSPSRGLQEWAAEHYPAGHPKRQETYRLGDVNTTIIKTALGKTITVIFDTNLPHPYDRINKVQGTKGMVHGYPNRVYVEGVSKRNDQWDDMARLVRGVRPPALESDPQPQGRVRRSRRHGLPRGLPPDQVHARGCADGHECVRRRGDQLRRRALVHLRRQRQPADRRARLHARPVEDNVALADRHDLGSATGSHRTARLRSRRLPPGLPPKNRADTRTLVSRTIFTSGPGLDSRI